MHDRRTFWPPLISPSECTSAHGFVPLPAGPGAPGAGLFGLVGPDRLVGFRPKLPIEEPPIFEPGSLIVPVEGGVFGTGLVAPSPIDPSDGEPAPVLGGAPGAPMAPAPV